MLSILKKSRCYELLTLSGLSDRTFASERVKLVVCLLFDRHKVSRIVLIKTVRFLDISRLLNTERVLSVSNHALVSHAVWVTRICVSAVYDAVFEVGNVLLVLIQFHMGQ